MKDDAFPGWTAVETDAVTRWEHDDRDLAIEVSEHGQALKVALCRCIAVDGYEAELETTVLSARTTDEAATAMQTLASEVAEDVGNVVPVGAESATVGDEEFIHFYCVFDSLLPEDVTADDLVFEDDVDTEETVGTISSSELDEDDELDGIPLRLDIYPVPAYDVIVHD